MQIAIYILAGIAAAEAAIRLCHSYSDRCILVGEKYLTSDRLEGAGFEFDPRFLVYRRRDLVACWTRRGWVVQREGYR